MIGDFKIIGDICYLEVNIQGTLQKLPSMSWWWKLFFAIKQHFKGSINIKEIETVCKKGKK